MTIMQIVAVRDTKADTYSRPFFVPTLGMAIRSFHDEVNRVDQNNELNKHPEDFNLYHLGTFEDEKGTFNGLDQPKQIAIGSQMRTA